MKSQMKLGRIKNLIKSAGFNIGFLITDLEVSFECADIAVDVEADIVLLLVVDHFELNLLAVVATADG